MLLGLHHVTAIASDPQRNLDFYTGFLGLTLVKRTVNFDDPGTHHLYFGDRHGTPGTLLTFFPWVGSARTVRKGPGQITAIAFHVASASEWREWAARAGLPVQVSEREGLPITALADPDGLTLELVEHPASDALGRLSGITIREAQAGSTGQLLVEHLGFEQTAPDAFTLSGAQVRVTHQPGERGAIAPGGVHHVALGVGSIEEQSDFRARLLAAGFKVTLPQDRVYFQSIYFRQPHGVLFEIATLTPGFFTDEAVLGERLCLPPWLEPSRASIESRLAPLGSRHG